MKIKVLGPGCAKCKQLAEVTATTATELGIDFQIEKISDLHEISKFGVMMTPALVINGEVKSVGKIPTINELKEILQ